MCGIGGILRIVKPGDPDYPSDGAPTREASGAWLWHGLDVRDLRYAPVDEAPSNLAQVSSLKPQDSSWLIPEPWLDAMDEKIAWRGPDGAGRFRDRVIKPDGTIVEVALVHRRLSIIDHETGAQPMVSRGCPRCDELARGFASSPQVSSLKPQAPLLAVVFNGCIYNHSELRRELEAKGHEFFTDHSDTEVLIHGYREWGRIDSHHFEGMYAVGVWDRAWARISMHRDPFGEKPIYFSPQRTPYFLSFSNAASSLYALRETQALAQGVRTNPRLLADWLTFGFSDEATPHATILSARPYASLATDAPEAEPSQSPFSDAVVGMVTAHVGGLISRATRLGRLRSWPIEHVERVFDKAVQRRLEADVPLGCFLSGGIDSSLVAVFARRALGRLTTLCVRAPGEEYDESPAAERVAKFLDCEHHTIDVSAQPSEDLVRLITLLGVPFGDSSILPAYWVSQASRQCVKVALSGDGGDELFLGYERYVAADWTGLAFLLAYLVPVSRFDRRNPKARGDRCARFWTAARHWQYADLLAVFPTPDRVALIGDHEGPMLEASLDYEGIRGAQAFDVDYYLPGDLLRKVDTASLAAGLEVRCPVLDSELATDVFAMSTLRLRRGGHTKGYLRELARKHLPPGIADRPKQGFAIPISDWFRTDFGGLRTLLLDHLEGDRPFGKVHDVLEINMGFVRQMLDEHWAAGGLTPMHTTRAVRKRDHGQRLFALLSLAIWSRTL